jgi:hypothetical protein
VSEASGEQSYLVFPGGGGAIKPATHIRSTLIVSSQKRLRDEGLFPEYEKHLDPALQNTLIETSVARWLDIELGLAHYQACEALGLGPNRIAEIGQGVGMQRRGTFLGVAVGLAAGIGVTPWTVLAQADRLWKRAFQGGAMGTLKTGEREARIEVVGWPCARIPYCRHALRGLVLGVMGLLSPHVSLHEILPLHKDSAVAYRLAWR